MSCKTIRLGAMSFDIGFKKFDLTALKFNDVFDQITNRYNANHFIIFKHR